jgi:dipeptidyl aminopeptidase/acylaminoacyl peptidase
MAWPDGAVSRLTNDLTDYLQVSLTADRVSLATARIHRRVGIWTSDADGSRPVEVVPAAIYPVNVRTHVSWAGPRPLFTTSNQGSAISAVSPGAGTPVELVRAAGEPAGSADGRRIVYRSFDEDAAKGGVWMVDGDGRGPTRIREETASAPLVTPDGETVVFLSVRSGVQSPWAQSIVSGAATQLSEVFVPGLALDISRDGKSVAFYEGIRVIVVCQLPACAGRRELPAPVRGLGRIRWTPDGKGIAYMDVAAINLMVQPLDGGSPRALTQFKDGIIEDFAWSPDGTRLAIARAMTTRDIVMFKGIR